MAGYTRRDALALGIGGLVGLGGCAGVSAHSTTPGSVFEDVGFEGENMVVTLRDGHDVERVNLISPDGSRYTGTNVPVGATTVRLEVLHLTEYKPHQYTPGKNTLVAINSGEAIEKKVIDLQPAAHIEQVTYADTAEKAGGFGTLDVAVRNVGTGPLWVYEITFEDAPSRSANSEISEMSGIGWFGRGVTHQSMILDPGAAGHYPSMHAPLVFTGKEQSPCTRTYDFTVVLAVKPGPPVKAGVRAAMHGERIDPPAYDTYKCANATIALRSDK